MTRWSLTCKPNNFSPRERVNWQVRHLVSTCLFYTRMIFLGSRLKSQLVNSPFAGLLLFSSDVMASFNGPTTLNRMLDNFESLEEFWLLILALLFVVYPLVMSLLLAIAGKLSGLNLLTRHTVLQSLGVAAFGLVVALCLFVFIFITALLFLDIDPEIYYALFWLFIAALSYRTIKDAMLAERRKKASRMDNN